MPFDIAISTGMRGCASHSDFQSEREKMLDEVRMRLQDIADAIIMLKLHRIIPDSVVHNAEQKLMKKIIECESLAEQDGDQR